MVTQGSDTQAKWKAAQVGERRFHCDEDSKLPSLAKRRAQEQAMRRFYAGMLHIPFLGEREAGEPMPTITDFGGGPESLVLIADVHRERSVVVDPLTFSNDDELRYERAGIRRVMQIGEEYAGEGTDECWMYNCLQHVQSPEQVLQVALTHTLHTFRIFEWVHTPTDRMHLHSLKSEMLRSALYDAGLHEVRSVEGRAAHIPYWNQEFYAGVWTR